MCASDRSEADQWAGRVEGAAVRLRTVTSSLSATADQSAQAGRLVALAPLRSDADELVRQANLLVRFAAEPPGGPYSPKSGAGAVTGASEESWASGRVGSQ